MSETPPEAYVLAWVALAAVAWVVLGSAVVIL